MKKPLQIMLILTIAVMFSATAQAISVKALLTSGAKLNGKKVTVSGKVTKINMNIMGRNWIHLKDNSSQKDLVLTSSQPARPGQHVSAVCTVATNKDFGSGYFYKILLENCQLK